MKTVQQVVSTEMMELVVGAAHTDQQAFDDAVAKSYNELGASMRQFELLELVREDEMARKFFDFYIDIFAISEKYALECGGSASDMITEIIYVLQLIPRAK